MSKIDKLICPLCSSKLSFIYRNLKCPQDHHFDVAKEGYFNLLLPQHKQSKDPGDSKVMVQARRHFHDLALYKDLAEPLSSIFRDSNCLNVVDLGCGEGSYGKWLMAQIPAIEYYGVDISRHAIRAASKENDTGTFTVASNWHLPLDDNSFDHALSIFAPVSQKQLQRILRQGGTWINVTPGTRHLEEIRSVLYDTVEEIEKDAEQPDWKVKNTLSLTYDRNLDQKTLISLLEMTPYVWQANPARQETLKSMTSMKVTFDFRITSLELDL